MKKIAVVILISCLIGIAGCANESSPFTQSTDMVVIRGYVYANEPVSDIKLTSTLPLGTEEQSGPPINNASVVLVKNGMRYALSPSPGDSGYYHYDGSNLTITAGDHLGIEVSYFDKLATGETVAPPPPGGVTISREELVVPYFGGFGFGGGGFATIDTTNTQVTVRWENQNKSLYFVSVENVDSNPQSISSNRPFFSNFRWISQPIAGNEYTVRFNTITSLGRHRMKVYSINQEYADLYASRNQDSRDLNEPLTNITNGLGVFSAFNSDSVFFNAIEE